jgi:hypothetical protein
MHLSPQAYPIHWQSFEEVLPSLTQCLQEEVLSHRQRLGNAKLLSIRPPDDEFIEQSKNYLNIWSNLFLSTVKVVLKG